MIYDWLELTEIAVLETYSGDCYVYKFVIAEDQPASQRVIG